MKPDHVHRRVFLGGLFAGLTAWLCPQSTSVTAPRQPASTAAPSPNAGCLCYHYDSNGHRCTTYDYDGMGRLVSMTNHPPSVSFTYEPGNTYNHNAEG